MSDIAIRVENLSKLYRIGARQNRHDTLRDALVAPFQRLAASLGNQRLAIGNRQSEDTIWALKDVSFEVHHGEVVGIIGRNGAGKSTLLKILSRITEPTAGYADIEGRVGSLLEVGTGFHPELAGRDNVYLNGAILGMKKTEIERKFDEIVAFAEIEKFLDTPVKHYSSGMYVRLAFAVAAHLEPEILLVDEVLAVGDAAFQERCLGKMRDVAGEGRTVLFVSHNMGAIRSLTHRCIYLKDGGKQAYGSTEQVVQQYLDDILGHTKEERPRLDQYHRESTCQSPVRFTRVWVDDKVNEVPIIEMGQDFTIFAELETSTEIRGAYLALGINKRDGIRVTELVSIDHGFRLHLPPGNGVVCCTIRGLPLTPGEYFVGLGVNPYLGSQAWDVILDYPLLRVEDRAGKLIHRTDRSWGAVHWSKVTWSILH